jgi:excisionase family DNA binding protein
LRCSKKTIRRRIDAGTLPASKQGGRWLFEATAIRAALIAGMVRTKSPVASDRSAFATRAQADTSNQQELKDIPMNFSTA